MSKRFGRCLLVLLLAGLPGGAVPSAQVAPWWKALPRPVYRELERVPVKSPWFEVYRVGPGTTALYEPGHWQEAISYLIEGRERAVLFDTGLGIGDIKAVVDQLTSLPVLVVNSHEHFDHIGGDRLFADVAVADNPAALARLAKGTGSLSKQITAETVWMPLPPGFDPARYETPPIQPTRRLHDGERIELGGRTLEVLLTPGHTPGSLSLLDRGRRVLFTGDTLYPAELYAHMPESSLADYERSAARLGALADSVDVVCPGHNEAKVPASILPRFARAFAAIERGEVKAIPERQGVVRYEAEGIVVLAREREP
ncbi:MAG TPA: MBL fold metallo-hydrolase [Vicinamibacterales bacterium]|nr:MBL fold metallo-hydrolase [Vicinamibacterales bacterium]